MLKTVHNARLSAAIGAAFWLVLLFIRTGDSSETELIQKILLLGISVIIPLGFALVPVTPMEQDSLLYRAATSAQPVAAVASAFSFLLSPGQPAAILALSWLLVTTVIGAFGLRRILKRGPSFSHEIFVDAALLYLPIGAAWFVASRFGLQPMGFGDTIVLLTATHFHFAGFAAPILAGLVGRSMIGVGQTIHAIFVLAGICIVGGTPLVAAGITFSPMLALTGAAVISIGLTLLAILVFGWVLNKVNSFLAQTLLVVSSLSNIAAMVLACLYAYSLVAKIVIVDIPQMAMTHGILNSLGFALCGLIGWTLASRAEETRSRIDTK